ncbi:MAG: hypothetical protein H8E27_07505 [Verrucomicrobia subdivision 3 bacterium]|nr:hypothetical protein [Limisphaerales bacterium]
MNRRIQHWLVAALLLGSVGVSWACTVPVFRFALEQWPPDQFEVVLFHEGALTTAQAALLEKIQPKKTENTTVPNIRIHQVDLKGQPDARWVSWWEKNKPAEATGPRLVIFYPASTMIMTPVWSGEFKADLVSNALQSPARKKVAAQLEAGDSAVWVLVECGDQEKDAAAKKLLETRLQIMAQKLKLPEVKAQDIQSGYLSIRPEDLKLSFSVVTLRAGDTAEDAFRETLLNSEEDLKELSHEPMGFPIFGRGRALPALVGKGINAQMIDEASAFLSGPCSCQVKRQNPGFDLLTSVDWDQLLENQIRAYDDRAQANISVETPPPNSPNPKPEAAGDPQDSKTPVTPSRPFLGLIPLIGLPILIAGGLIVFLGRQPGD